MSQIPVRKSLLNLLISIANSENLIFKWKCYDADILSFSINLTEEATGKLIKQWTGIPAESNSFTVPHKYAKSLHKERRYIWLVRAVYPEEDLWSLRTSFLLVNYKLYLNHQKLIRKNNPCG